MIFDGDCHFCRRWIERWRQQTGNAVEYEPSQKVAPQFPEIPTVEFQNAVILITPDGKVYRAAEAVFRSLACGRQRWPLTLYEKIPGFASISETAYDFVSRHRELASNLTRMLWGRDVRVPTYFVSRGIFLRAVGLNYLIAFVSLWVQVDGLVGERGILPVRNFLPAMKAGYGTRAILALPTICWVNSSNSALHLLCGAGVIASVALMAGVGPVIALTLCFCSYLSLTIAGQTFLSFQWDILLLETGFLAIFLAPLQWRMARGRDIAISGVALFLLKFLLFKLMFMSGVVKLTSGDDCWWNLTALDYHYWTQPLPTLVAWWADKHPEWFKKFSVAFCLVVEIIVPFFIWAPRRLRLLAAALVVSLQIAIALTGNYCFFNLVTIALCILLIDDVVWRRRRRGALQSAVFRDGGTRTVVSAGVFQRLWSFAAVAVLIITLPLNLWLNYTAIRPEAAWPESLGVLYAYIEPFRIANGYGLFRVMTKERPEIQVEGSADGIDWAVYDFKWKPGDVNRLPDWCAPHQPRLDWQMWFAALGGRREESWFGNFALRLLQNEPAVTRLLEHNPFASKAPRYIRATLFKYEFTTKEEHHATGAWWKRREIVEYLPEVSLQ
jgi:predicted DCC family thiol-disulfide oxidoreductase YuxK